MRKFVLVVFVFVVGFLLGSETSRHFYSETHFEANLLDHYIYKNKEFEDVKASEIFADRNKNWLEICDRGDPKSDKDLKISQEIITDHFLTEYLHSIVLRSEFEILVLKFDERKYRFDSDLSCAPLAAVSVSARVAPADGKKTIVTLKEIR